MKFVLADTNRYWWPVTVRVPDPDKAGALASQTLRIQFEPQGQDEFIAAQEVYEGLRSLRDRVEHEHEQLLKVVCNWDDVVGEDGGSVAFSAETFRAACQQSWFRLAVLQVYGDSLNGREAALGN